MKIDIKFILKILLLVALCSVFVHGQKPNYKFRSLDLSDGLVNGTIYKLYEDSFGFLWIGTQQGLQRYDGVSFKTFESSDDDPNSLWNNFTFSCYEDHQKNIWIATPRGINKYNRNTDKIERISFVNESESDLSLYNNFFSIIGDKNDKNILWLVGRGLIRYNIESGAHRVFELENFHENRDVAASILTWISHHPLDNKKLLLGSDKLYSFDTETYRFDELLALEQSEMISNNLINDVIIDEDNNDIIWLATGDIWGRGKLGGLIQYDLRKNRKNYFTPKNRPNELLDHHLLSLCSDQNGNIWIGTRYRGAYYYDKRKDQFFNYSKDQLNSESFVTGSSVLKILMDRSGTIWFGTWGDGIGILSPSTQKFIHYKSHPSKESSLLDNYIQTFAEDKNGDIWIGTEQGGLTKFNPITKKFENYYPEFVNRKEPISITYLYYDSNNLLWIGTYQDALHRYDPETGKKEHFKKGDTDQNVTQNRINAITELKQGEVLIATYGGGLNIYDYSTGDFSHYVNDSADSTSIPDNQVWLPLKGNDGNYYLFGNSTASLIKLDPVTKEFYDLSDSTDISTSIWPMKNSNGDFYINDVSGGLKVLEIGTDISVYEILDINGNRVSDYEGIQIDASNKLWLGTARGLMEYDPETKIVTQYDPDDGLQNYKFNRYAALKTSTGQMYFGGDNGFNTFYPNEIQSSSFKPNIVFVGFKLFQNDVVISENSVLKKSITVSEKIQLDYDENDFTIEFAAIDFSNPGKILYKYILENHDKDWIDGGHKNFASYTNMDPGSYTFKVLATNSDGVWINKPSEVEISISPPFWQSTFAYFFYAVLLIAGIFTVDRVQRKRVIAKERVAAQIREAELRAQIAEKENERKSYELEEARKLQLSMLPKEIPQLPNLDIAVYMKTATEVGGDYYDFHVHLDGTLTVVLGDATGHGMMSGMMVSIMKSLFMSDRSSKELKPFFQNTNHAIKDMHLGRLMMALTCIQFNSEKIKIANAGMPSVFIHRNLEQKVDEITINNLPLGAIKNFEYEIKEEKINPGDTILLMTDGYAELKNENEEMIGYGRTRNLFNETAKKSPEEIIVYLNEVGTQWTKGKENDDDVTFVVIKVK